MNADFIVLINLPLKREAEAFFQDKIYGIRQLASCVAIFFWEVFCILYFLEEFDIRSKSEALRAGTVVLREYLPLV